MSETETAREAARLIKDDDVEALRAALFRAGEHYVEAHGSNPPVEFLAATGALRSLDQRLLRIQHLTQALEERDGWLYAAQEFYQAWAANSGIGFVQETEAFRQAMLEAARALTPTTPPEEA